MSRWNFSFRKSERGRKEGVREVRNIQIISFDTGTLISGPLRPFLIGVNSDKPHLFFKSN